MFHYPKVSLSGQSRLAINSGSRGSTFTNESQDFTFERIFNLLLQRRI